MAIDAAAVPLYVDVDGTLVKADLFIEGALQLLKRNPIYGVAMLVWLVTGGKAYVKAKIAQHVKTDVEYLPLQKEFVSFLEAEAAGARPIYLASAADAHAVKPLADRLGFFAGVLASDGRTNLAGSRKLDAILAHCGNLPFDYAGNAQPDLAIWRRARRALLVNPERGVEKALRSTGKVERVFEDRPHGPSVYLRALRVHQWLKNLLLGVPLLMAQAWDEPHALGAVVIAFFAFGLCASMTYLFNDLLDLPSDRRHEYKCQRPIASGDISLSVAGTLIALLLLGGIGLAALLPPRFGWMLLAYLVVTSSYTLYVKNLMLMDVIFLGGLYTLRILAGAAATDIEVSNWLLAFSVFLFLSLALVKRCAELVSLRRQGQFTVAGRDYRLDDYPILATMGVASGYVAVLVLALYIDSYDGGSHYAQPRVLWLLCPAILFWVSRLWIKTARGEMHHDPVIYSLKDRTSWFVLAGIACVWIAAQLSG